MTIKQKLAMARNAVDQTKAISECLLCRERQQQIEKHHPQADKVLGTVKALTSCPTCKPIIKQIISCAKMGHIYDTQNNTA